MKSIGLYIFFLFLFVGCSQPKATTRPSFISKTEAASLNEMDSLVDVGGFQLHIHCLGSGSPTVILESGFGWHGYYWSLVQKEVARFTRVCSYDRAGYGLSELTLNPRTNKAVAKELHALLNAAQISGPYLLVGHSRGGIYVRTFEELYSNEVAGLILVDSVQEELDEQVAAISKPKPPLMERVWEFLLMNQPVFFIKKIALKRDLRERPQPAGFSDEQWEYAINMVTTPNSIHAILEELELVSSAQRGGELKKMRKDLGDKPLIVISRGKLNDMPGDEEMQVYHRELEKLWASLQLKLTRLSSNSRHLIAKESGHSIPLEQPQIVVESIRDMIKGLQKQTFDANGTQ